MSRFNPDVKTRLHDSTGFEKDHFFKTNKPADKLTCILLGLFRPLQIHEALNIILGRGVIDSDYANNRGVIPINQVHLDKLKSRKIR